MTELNKETKKEVQKEVDKKVSEAKEEIKDFEKSVEKRLAKKLIHKATKTATMLGTEFRHHAATAIMAAFGFIIALVWKDLIVKLVEQIAADNLIARYPYIADLFSAIIVTAVSVVGIIFISKWAKKDESVVS